MASQWIVIGRGRLARHLPSLWSAYGLAPPRAWADARDLKAERARDPVPLAPQELTHFFLAVADRAIESTAIALGDLLTPRERTLSCFWHASGSAVTSAAFGAHPLFSFSERIATPEEYRSIGWVIDAGAPQFPLPAAVQVRLAPEHKPLYHALCVLAGPGAMLLWQSLERTLSERLGVASLDARALVAAYLRALPENFLRAGATALTGPWVRRDQATTELHHTALRGTELGAVYTALEEAYESHRINT